MGDFLVTGSNDRSVKLWQRTDEQLFPEEEREKKLEAVFDKQLTQGAAEEDGEGSASASKRTIETVTAGERLIETLEIAEEEVQMLVEYDEKVAKAVMKQKEARYHAKEAREAKAAAKKKAKKAKSKRGRNEEEEEVLENDEEEDVALVVPRPQSNPLMLGLSAPAYVLRALKMIRAQHLEEALLVLPFSAVEVLLRFLDKLIIVDGGKVHL
jgi:U3 small nucleolar RNA-associated protein 12